MWLESFWPVWRLPLWLRSTPRCRLLGFTRWRRFVTNDGARMTVLEAVDLAKVYTGGDGGTITVLDGINLDVERGEMVAVVGASGAGESTLLHLLGALDKPTPGSGRIDGQSLADRADDALSELRNRSVGFVFQFHHLLREFTALENVMMPMRIAGWDERRATARAEELLGRVGLGGRTKHKPAALSGGEQ